MTARTAWKGSAQSTLMGAAKDLDEAADWWHAQYVVGKAVGLDSPINIRIQRFRRRARELRALAVEKK